MEYFICIQKLILHPIYFIRSFVCTIFHVIFVIYLRRIGNQSENYATVGSQRQEWSKEASSRLCINCGAKRRGSAIGSDFRGEAIKRHTSTHSSRRITINLNASLYAFKK